MEGNSAESFININLINAEGEHQHHVKYNIQ